MKAETINQGKTRNVILHFDSGEVGVVWGGFLSLYHSAADWHNRDPYRTLSLNESHYVTLEAGYVAVHPEIIALYTSENDYGLGRMPVMTLSLEEIEWIA